MEGYQELWQVVQQVVPGAELEPATLQLDLEQYRSKLLNLFCNKGPEQALRQQISTGKVLTPMFGEVKLDYDPDQLQVIELSNKLRLDEVTCVELLTYAQEMWGNGVLEGALGVYLTERLDAARSLSRLFALQLYHQLEVGMTDEADGGQMDGAAGDGTSLSLTALMEAQPLLGVVVKFNEALLREEQGGRNVLISRLAEVIKDHSLDALGPPLHVAVDQYGCKSFRVWYTNQERTELCRALLYAIVLSPTVLKPSTVADLMGLLESKAAKVKHAGPNASHALLQQATSILLGVVAAISLGNAASDAGQPQAKVAELLRAPELQEHLNRVSRAEDGFSAVVALAWALTKDALSSNKTAAGGVNPDGQNPATSPSALLESAGKARALGTLSGLLASTAFNLEPEQEHKHLCARMVYKLLTEMLHFDTVNRREMTESLIKSSKQHMTQQVSSSGGGSYMPTAAVAPPGTPTAGQLAFPSPSAVATPGAAGAQQQGQQQQAAQDDLSSLLEALAAVFRVRPGLWFDGEAPEAYAYVSSFMSYVAVHPAMQIPDVRVSFLSVMTSLAAGPRGSRFILAQFRQNATKAELEHFTWKKLFQSVVAFCRRYEELERDAMPAGGSVVPTGLLAARDDALMLPGDAALLVAYLDLFSAIIENGKVSEMRTELQAIEREVSSVLLGLPIYEPLFQLMCHGVPSVVKAAVHRVIAALGKFKDAALRLLERLMAAAVVAPSQSVLEGYTGMPRFDLLAQINEVEARSEDYSESLAFITLVNRLLETLGPQGLPSGAHVLAPYTQLVLQFVVGHLWQRGYRDPVQKWQLAAVCFKHCQLALSALNTCPPITQNLLTGHPTGRGPPPGLAVLLSLMGGRQLEKAVLQHVLQPGQEELAAAMEVGAEGPHRLKACLEALRLLNLALEYDQAALEQISSFSSRERLAPLHQLLLVPQRRLAVLLQYVLYPDTEVQFEAVKLMSQVAARLPNLVALLQPNFDDVAAVLIRQGCAQSLELALLDPAAGQGVSSSMAAAAAAAVGIADPATNASDSRAEMLLDVMLGTLNNCPAPALGHLLLGFDTTAPPQDWYRQTLQPHVEFTCMSVLLRALQATPLQTAKPVLYAKCLQLLQTVAAAPLTCEPVFRLLHPQEATGPLLPSLAGVLLQPLPVEDAALTEASPTVHAQVASLHQRRYVLRLYALALLRCEQPVMLEPVLAALLDPAAAASYSQSAGYDAQQQNGFAGFSGSGFHAANGASMYGSGSAPPVLMALQQICSVVLKEPSLKDMPSELQQLQNEMMVDDVSIIRLLTQPQAMEACGIVTQDDHGQSVFDFTVLQRLLYECFEDYVNKAGARGGPGEKLAREAVAAAFRYAQQVNAHALMAGAQRAAVEAWVNTLNIAFTKTYNLINTKTAPGCGPELLHSCVLGILGLINNLASQQSGQLAETLAGCCRVLLSKLQELASISLSLGLPGDPLSQVRLPARCVVLLQKMLDCLMISQGYKGLRYEMYVVLLQYLHFCRGSKLGDCPPLVLASLLTGAGPGASAAQLDALQQQLERDNGQALRPKMGDLVKLMQGDVLQPPERGGSGQAVALHLLSALIAADPSSTVLADALHRANIPRGLLECVATHAPQILLQPAHKSQAALLVLEAQLSLLLSLVSAGGPTARKGSTKAVADAGALPYLTACKALDYTPEQPSNHQRTKRAGSLRYRLVHLISPVLRLVLALLAGVPGSSGLSEQAANFASAHLDMLARVLQEAANPATAAWAPGDEELEMAALAVSLLSMLPGALSAGSKGALTGLRRDMWRLWLVLAGHDRKDGTAASSIVAPLYAAGADASGANRSSFHRRRNLLLQLRCGLARCLKDSVTPAPRKGGPAAASSELLACVGHQAQTTVDAMGRPTLLLIRDTADQALQDTSTLAEELEDLLSFLQSPDSLTSNAAVAQKLADWGPGLAALNPTLNSNPQQQREASGGADNSLALVPAGVADGQGATPDRAVVAAAGGASGFGGLDPSAARRLARQCAARGATDVLQQLGKQLHLLEQCLAIVLVHFVQCLPRPDTAAALAASGDSNGLDADMTDDSTPTGLSGLGGSDQLLPNPGPDAAAKLGKIADIQFLATKMRDVCAGSDENVMKVRSVLAMAGGDSGGRAIGAEVFDDSLESVELLNRQLKAYLANL